MGGFSTFMAYAMFAVFAQNIVITSAAGVNSALGAAAKPKKIPLTALFVSVFAMLASLTMLPLNIFFSTETSYMPVHGALLTLFILLWYLIISNIVSKIEFLSEHIGEYIAPAAFNGAVIGLPLLLNFNNMGSTAIEVLGVGFGAGLGFALAAALVAAGLNFTDRAGVPKAFGGAPLMLIYIGVLSMGFSVFDGYFEYFAI
ncbi:MAG: hypothetical protein IJP10_04345 [Clostridia bacterium]|nr:hypothetical protein [Clostridia bacterium]